MATILPPDANRGQLEASRTTQSEQRTRQRQPADPPTSHQEPAAAEVMEEAEKIYPETAAGPTREEIAAEAYAIYLGRGGEHGHDLEDWFEAERLLRESRETKRLPIG